MISSNIESDDRDFIIDVAKRLIPIKSISPYSGGKGEKERADEICKIISELGFDNFQRYDVEDSTGAVRSNVVLRTGDSEKTFWIISHIDTVPEGDRTLWTKPPFQLTIENDKMFGRGTADNGQAVFMSLLLLKKLRKESLQYNLGLAFVADEEVGSKYGIAHLLDQNIFKKGDLILVPDAGTEDGLEIEIAEKSLLWIKFTVSGKQYHASMPFNAVNASRESMKFMLELDSMLHEMYNSTNDIFVPPYSTFEPTKHEKNVDNINTIPGLDVQYLDSRILPKYDLDHVIDNIDTKIRDFEKRSPAKISYEIVQREQAPPPTDESSEIVSRLKSAIEKKRGSKAHAVGIGGGTCAAFFRRKGFDAAVWSTTIPESAHQADEYCHISHIVADRDVIAEILYSQESD